MNLFGRGLGIAFAIILLTVGTLGTVATLMGFFGSTWWLFDLIANFRVLLMLTLLIVGVIYGMVFGRAGAVVFFAAGLINLLVILPLYLGNQPDPTTTTDDDITITIHNVTASNQNRTDVFDHLAGTGSDLVFVFESSVDWERAARLADLPYDIVAVPDPERRFGTMVLAQPGLDVEVEQIFVSNDLDTIARVTIGDVVVLAAHPRSPTNSDGSNKRDDLLAALTDLAAAEGEATIVVGDLNATPWSHAVRSLQDEAELRNSLQGYGLQPTWHADWRLFAIPIDHALMSQDLTTVSRSTGPANGSDHLPVTVTISPVG
ncbi:MAG: endonuclease/exonuclease/phosphatase family protein [Acidimicrobiia bacterium]|nr:endonuclease/exonuclease/phosphatase family protein [Acidimicrobiia bacterium]